MFVTIPRTRAQSRVAAVHAEILADVQDTLEDTVLTFEALHRISLVLDAAADPRSYLHSPLSSVTTSPPASPRSPVYSPPPSPTYIAMPPAMATLPKMPMPSSRDAPRFRSDPVGFEAFFDDVAELASRCGLGQRDAIDWACRYARKEAEAWKQLTVYEEDDTTLEMFRAAVRADYPPLTSDRRYTSRDLDRLIDRTDRLRDLSQDELGEYYRKFKRISSYLVAHGRLWEKECGKEYLRGMPRPLRQGVRKRLAVKFLDVDPEDGYELSDVHDAAIFVIRGLRDNRRRGRYRSRSDSRDRSRSRSDESRSRSRRDSRSRSRGHSRTRSHRRSRYHSRSGSRSRSRSRDRARRRDSGRNRDRSQDRPASTVVASQPATATQPPPTVAPSDDRLLEVLSRIIHVQQQQPVMAPPQPTRAYQPAPSAPRQPPYQSVAQTTPGGVAQNPPRWNQSSEGCMFCSSPDHYLRDCPVVTQYLQAGKIARNDAGRLTLPDGRYLPRVIPGANMRERFDKYYMTPGFPGRENNARNVVATHFFESPEECVFTVDVPPTFIDHSDDDQHEKAQVNAVQGKKEKFDGVQVPQKFVPPQKRNPQPPVQQQSRTTAPRTGRPGDRARDPPPHAPRLPQGPMKPVEMPTKPPADDPKYRYQSAIETSVKTTELVDRALESKVTLSTRELMAVSPEVRKQVRELVANKKVSAHTMEEGVVDSYLSSCFDNATSSTAFLNIERYDGMHSPSAMSSLPLRVIFPTFAAGVEPECILDGGAQIVAMRRDVWELTGAPLTANKAMTMESANAGMVKTLGLVENHPVRLGPITVYLQIQVIENAPFEVLLGRPFFDVLSCSEVSQAGGSHEIHVTDPKTGTPYVFPTEPRFRRRHQPKQESAVNFRA